MIRIAVVGTGSIGMSHLQAIKESQDCVLCALCDINEVKVKELAEEYQVPYFLDYHDIPGKVEADAVILNLPHFLHCESTVFFLEQGIHVLVEKPMANTVKECNRMIEAAKKHHCKLAVGHVMRYYDVFAFLKRVVAEETFGKLCMVTNFRSADYFADSRPRWFLDKKLAGGGIGMNYGAHAMDTLFYVTGEKEAEVCSSFANPINEYSIEAHVQFMVKLPNGISMTQTLSGYGNFGHEIVYYFTNGVVKAVGVQELYQWKDGNWEPIAIVKSGPTMERQLKDFCSLVEGRDAGILCTAEEGKAVIKVLNEVYDCAP